MRVAQPFQEPAALAACGAAAQTAPPPAGSRTGPRRKGRKGQTLNATRWIMLIALTSARFAVGFQIVSVASVTVHLQGAFDIDHAGVGTLASLYLLPGLLLAIPAGWLGFRFGDRTMVLVSLVLMVVGGCIATIAVDPVMLGAGRIVAGSGGVMMIVLNNKMIADWFDSRTIVTAMAVMMSGFALGIGLGMVVHVFFADLAGWPAAQWSTAAMAAIAFLLTLTIYRDPPPEHVYRNSGGVPDGPPRFRIERPEVVLICLAGLIWALYNASYLSFLTYGPGVLGGRNVDAQTAGWIMALGNWLAIGAMPIGGWLADRFRSPGMMVLVGGVVLGVAEIGLAISSVPLLSALAFGIFGAMPAAIIAALPGQVLKPASRSAGVGIFYIWFFAGGAVLPPLGGLARDMTGLLVAPMAVAVCFIVLALIVYAIFRAVQSAGRPVVVPA